MTGRRVAVVGAGIAGLAAARRLALAGADVELFDKGRAPGGRVSTRRHGELRFDHGAQYFTARDPSFERVVSDWCARGVAAVWDERVAAIGNGAVEPARGDETRYVGVPAMSAIARDLANGLRVACEQRVTEVERTGEQWRLAFQNGPARGGFDAVVLATPAPQAAPLLAAVPAFADRVARVTMQPCHAVLVALPKPLEVDFGGAFVSNSPLAWIARDASKPGRAKRECWVLHTTPEWSSAHRDDDADDVAGALLAALGAALGRSIPDPLHCTTHRWLFARSARPLGEPCLWDPQVRVGVCGDWAFGGRVENAFRSGDLLAGRMLADRSH